MERSRHNVTSLEAELMAAGDIDPAIYYEALAQWLGVAFIAEMNAADLVECPHMDAALRDCAPVRVERAGQTMQVIAPCFAQFQDLAAIFERRPDLRARFAIATPATIRRCVWECRSIARARETTRRLFEGSASESARLVVTGAQGFFAGLALATLLLVLTAAPWTSLFVTHACLSLLFFACIAIRFFALKRTSADPWRRPNADPGVCPPVYTVLVALHDEASVVGELVASLSRLEWPRSLLEIKLVCEADDHATVAALESLDLPGEYEIVRVPVVGPRTKPKALSYALCGTTGDYLAIYDAEDHPHPEQLLEAHSVFRRSPWRIGFLQAPLVIANGRRSSWSALFALEYAGLFRMLLPMLARFGLPMPLGGTSNHFRMQALRESLAWDPHNVTEDADLGIRLYRRGYRGGVLNAPTLEVAPESRRVWQAQRTRWFKGWLQTWLVMMRAPRTLLAEMGPVGFLVFQVLIGGMILSALAHPLLIGFVVEGVLHIMPQFHAHTGVFGWTLFGMDAINFLGGYIGFLALAHRAMVPEERRRVRGRGWRLPFYWLEMSLAAWLAVFELARNPFYWAKTPHAPARTQKAKTALP
ncbi:glycosyltransferase family 2 protein [Pararhizobium mangrovi]|uniref:glycosyltransferase family 2 protein n=1 Tax=Pararhizobium mangrovi TaxID=2590452 RepID=UPI0015E82FD5|nr:glycosyltransferase family 2 protein [Pararhizobium mangrovi]